MYPTQTILNYVPVLIGLSPRILHQPPAELGFRNKTLQYLEQSVAHWIMRRRALAFMLPAIETGRRRTLQRAHPRLCGRNRWTGAAGSRSSVRSYGRKSRYGPNGARDIGCAYLYEMQLFWECVVQGKPVPGHFLPGVYSLSTWHWAEAFIQDIATEHPNAISLSIQALTISIAIRF